jgi:hypothetical protein
MTYSIDPQAVSRFLSSRTWERSRTIRGRIANEHTQGFTVREALGETRVEWHEDSRSYGRPGYFEPTLSMDERLTLLAKTLGDRYEVARREDTLLVSQRELAAPKTLSFKKVQGALGREYSAETGTHRYVVRRHPEDNSKWELKVWTLKAVGTLDPIMIADKVVYATCDDAKKYMIEEAFEYLKKIGN